MRKKILILVLFCFSGLYAQGNDEYNRFRLGQSYEQAGDYQKARAIYEPLYKADPLNYQYLESLERVYVQLKDFDAAIAMIEKRLAVNPDDITMYGNLGSIYFQKGDEKKAYKIWDEGLEKAPQSSVNYRVIANFAVERRAFEKAIEVLQKGKALSKDVNSYSFEIANLYSILMRFKEAAEEYCSILLQDPNQLGMVENRISSYLSKPEAYKATAEVVEKQAGKSGQVNFQLLLAWMYMENNDYSKAYEKYLEIEKSRPNGAAELLNFAQRALSNGHYEEAAKAYKRIIDKYPSTGYSANAEIGYAKTMETIVNKNNDSRIGNWMPYPAAQSASDKEYGDVIKAYSDLINSYKNNPIAAEAYLRIGLIKEARLNDLQGAKQSFTELLNNIPGSIYTVQAFINLAEISILENDLNQASGYFTRILNFPAVQKSERNYTDYMLAKIDFWEGKFSDAGRELDTASDDLADNIANDAIELSLLINTTKNDSLSLYEFAKADLLTRQKKYKEASEIYRELAKKDNLLTLKDLSAFRYAQMVTMTNDLPNAIALLGDLSSAEKNNIYADKALFLLGEIYQFGVKDLSQAKKSYEKLLANFPNSLYLDDARENINGMKIN